MLVLRRCLATAASLLPLKLGVYISTLLQNFLQAYCYCWPGFSLWIFLVGHTNRVSCLHMSHHDLSSVGLGMRVLIWEQEQHRLCTCSIIDHVWRTYDIYIYIDSAAVVLTRWGSLNSRPNKRLHCLDACYTGFEIPRKE